MMDKIIRAAVERGATDLHIKAGDVFRARINGRLVGLTKQRLTPDQTRAIALRLIASPDDRARIDSLRDYDCSWGMPGVGRFRVNVLRQRSSVMVVMRVIPFAVPTLDSLGLPPALATIAAGDRGLVVVAGVAGSGKSTTVAGMIQHVNSTQQRHIVTVESPIEFLHRDLSSSVTQREVGVDTDSYASGLRAALRQDPDVVLIGELQEPEVLLTAIKAAESGRLVLASLPTHDVPSTIERLVQLLPPEERELGRVRLAECLRAIVAQQLLPRADAPGKVVACEILCGTPKVRAALREAVRAADVRDLMATGADGMQTFTQHAQALLAAGTISAETARASTALQVDAPPAGVPDRRKRGKAADKAGA
jgi:twitching motility protein PilT